VRFEVVLSEKELSLILKIAVTVVALLRLL